MWTCRLARCISSLVDTEYTTQLPAYRYKVEEEEWACGRGATGRRTCTHVQNGRVAVVVVVVGRGEGYL